jgi:hypothetical protein
MYLLSISCFTDKIPRYIYIIFPFLIVQVFCEMFLIIRCLDRTMRIKLNNIFLALIFGMFSILTPKTFTDLKIAPKVEVDESAFRDIREHVNEGPVFSLTPFYSYLAGGTYRTLPNDSLEKVVTYGKKIGVQWLLIAFTGDARSEMTFYTNTKWYWSRSLDGDYPKLVRRCCGTPDGALVLYKIL